MKGRRFDHSLVDDLINERVSHEYVIEHGDRLFVDFEALARLVGHYVPGLEVGEGFIQRREWKRGTISGDEAKAVIFYDASYFEDLSPSALEFGIAYWDFKDANMLFGRTWRWEPRDPIGALFRRSHRISKKCGYGSIHYGRKGIASYRPDFPNSEMEGPTDRNLDHLDSILPSGAVHLMKALGRFRPNDLFVSILNGRNHRAEDDLYIFESWDWDK